MIILYEIVLFILVTIEYRRYHSYITPFTMMGSIYMLVPILVNATSTVSGIYPMSDVNLFFTMVYLFIFWCGNVIFLIIGKDNRDTKRILLDRYNAKIEYYQPVLFAVLFMGTVLFALNLRSAISVYGLKNLKNHTSGISAHFGYLALVIAPYCIAYALKKKRLITLGVAGLLMLITLLFQNKLPLIVLMVQTTYCMLITSGKTRDKSVIIKGALVAAASLVVFVFIYALQPYFIDHAMSFRDAAGRGLERFIHYFFSGFVSSNEYFVTPAGNSEGHRVVFGFLDTLYQVTFGDKNYIDPVIQKWVLIQDNSATNVGGLFSEAVYQVGYLEAGVYVWLIGSLVYLFFNMTSKYMVLINTTSYLVALTSLSFFCNFFSLFATFEKLIYVLLIDFMIGAIKPGSLIKCRMRKVMFRV